MFTYLLQLCGKFETNDRLNDVWVLDVVSMSWWQPNIQHNEKSSKPFSTSNLTTISTWCHVPPPRASHTATLINELMYVFGGYGGAGYSRSHLDDLYVLNTLTWIWTKVGAKGVGPEKRSSHQACGVGNSIFILGGCSSSCQYQVSIISEERVRKECIEQ